MAAMTNRERVERIKSGNDPFVAPRDVNWLCSLALSLLTQCEAAKAHYYDSSVNTLTTQGKWFAAMDATERDFPE